MEKGYFKETVRKGGTTVLPKPVKQTGKPAGKKQTDNGSSAKKEK